MEKLCAYIYREAPPETPRNRVSFSRKTDNFDIHKRNPVSLPPQATPEPPETPQKPGFSDYFILG